MIIIWIIGWILFEFHEENLFNEYTVLEMDFNKTTGILLSFNCVQTPCDTYIFLPHIYLSLEFIPWLENDRFINNCDFYLMMNKVLNL